MHHVANAAANTRHLTRCPRDTHILLSGPTVIKPFRDISAVLFTDFIVIAVLLTYPLHATRNKSNYQELRRILQDEE